MNELKLPARIAVTSAGVFVWAMALYGVLRVADLRVQWQHGICGPWGCGPPPQALIACHGFWIVLVLPVLVTTIRGASATTLKRIGIVTVVVGTLILIAIGCREWAGWYLDGTPAQRSVFVQRYLFAVATLIDIPAVEITLVGLGWLIAAAAKGLPRRMTAAHNKPSGAVFVATDVDRGPQKTVKPNTTRGI